MSFRNIKPGDRVRFMVPAGLGLVNGRVVEEFKPTVGRAQHLLCFAGHVVVDSGNGSPRVVDDSNYISHVPARVAA